MGGAVSDTFAHMQREPRTKRWKRRVYRRVFKCGDKQCFPDEVTARVGGMVSIEERRNATQLWVYKCVHCKRWHLTSQKQGERWAVLPRKWT